MRRLNLFFLGTNANADQFENTDKFGTRQLNEDFGEILKLYKGFIGREHFQSMIRLLGYSGISLIITYAIMPCTKETITNMILPYYQQLKDLMPSNDIRLPPSTSGTPLGYSKIKTILADFDSVEHQLGTEPNKHVFQYLREIGNGIIFVQMIERSLYSEEMENMFIVAPFTRQFPRIFIEPDDNFNSIAKKQDEMFKKYANLDLVSIANSFGDEDQIKIACQGNAASHDRLCNGLSLFGHLINEMRDEIKKNKEWKDSEKTSHANSRSFHRIWSACQWIMAGNAITTTEFNNESSTNEFNPMTIDLSGHQTEYIYGDGLNYAAMTIIFLLDENTAFNFLDFSYQLLNIRKNDTKSPVDQFKVIVTQEEATQRAKSIDGIIGKIIQIKR